MAAFGVLQPKRLSYKLYGWCSFGFLSSPVDAGVFFSPNESQGEYHKTQDIKVEKHFNRLGNRTKSICENKNQK